jgi:hypothetical protein
MPCRHGTENPSYREAIVTSKVFLAAVVLLSPVPALAQFTTVVAPAKKASPTPAAVAAAEVAKTDSVARVALTDMKVWVDSAAAAIAATPSPATIDSTAAAARTRAEVNAGEVAAPAPTTTFRSGARAPDTASTLPLLGLLAFGAMGMGALVLWRKSA